MNIPAKCIQDGSDAKKNKENLTNQGNRGSTYFLKRTPICGTPTRSKLERFI